MGRLGRAARTAAILFAVGGGTAAWFFFREVQPRDELRRKQEEEKRLFHFGRKHVVRGTLFTRGATISFERGSGSRFVLERPFSWPADPEALNALLDRMVTIKVDPLLTEAATPAELKGWGLENPHVRLDVVLQGGTHHSIRIGTKNPLVNAFPVTDEDSKRVGLAEPSFYWAFDRNPDDYRDRHLVALIPDRVRSLHILDASGKTQLHLVRPNAAETAYILKGEKEMKASEVRARGLIEALTTRLEAERFLSDTYSAGADDFGLQEPWVKVVFGTFEGQSTTLTFARFRQDPSDEGLLVAHPLDSQTVAEVDRSVAVRLKQTFGDLMDRTLSRFDPAIPREVELQLGTEGPIVVTRAERGWTVKKGPVRPLKGWRIDALIQAFSFLEGETIHERKPTRSERAEWLLDPPSRRLVFRDDQGQTVAAVRIGNRFDETHLLAQREGDETVYTVPERRLRALPGRFKDLVDPTAQSSP